MWTCGFFSKTFSWGSIDFDGLFQWSISAVTCYPKTTAKLSLRTSWRAYNCVVISKIVTHLWYVALLGSILYVHCHDKWALKLLLLFSDSLLPPSKLFLNLILMGRLASVVSPATYLLAYWAQSFFQSSHNNPGEELLQISHKIRATTTITFR